MAEMDDITLEQVHELFDMLRGGALPPGMSLNNQPKLGPKEAFTVIWFLQERMRILPDKYEQCSECLFLYNSETEGHYYEDTGLHFCDCTVMGYGPQDDEDD